MTPKGRALIGVITTVFFAGLAAMLLAEQRMLLAGIVALLAAIRGWYAVGQFRWAFLDEDELD